MAFLRVNGLATGFGSNQVLHGVDLSVDRGEIVVLLGLNGAGKSVTLKTMIGFVRAWDGRVELDGRDITGLDTETRIRRGMNYVPQTRGVFPLLTVAQNLRLGGATLNRAVYRDRLDHALNTYPRLGERLRQAAGKLSGGEQAMLAIARATMTAPNVLLLDEPSAGLSPSMVDVLAETLSLLRSGGTSIVLVEQNVHFGLGVADRAAILENGRVVYSAPAADLDQHRLASLLGIGTLLD